jgi:hypothetical protein
MPVVRITFLIALLTAGIGASMASAQTSKFPPLKEYMMPRDAEAALARSAAPANISSRATIKVLTTSGYQVIREGDNGFVCMVLRGWVAPTYTPTPVRELVYDATLRSPIASTVKRCAWCCLITSCGANLEWMARIPIRSPTLCRPRTPRETCPSGMRSRSRTCGPQTRFSTSGPLPSSHDGLLAVLQEFHAR